MRILRINAEPKLAHTEELFRQIRHRLPLAFLRPKTGKGYIDFMLDVSEDTLTELQAWLMYCGWDSEIAD